MVQNSKGCSEIDFMIKILMIGDTYGDPGRRAVGKFVPEMKKSGEVDFVVCNAENSADGAGLTEKTARELFGYGCDVLTMGDHAFDKRKEIEEMMKNDVRLVRPVNFSKALPGAGSTVLEQRGFKVGVIHVAGQVFMRYHFSSPFLADILRRCVLRLAPVVSRRTSSPV